MKLVIVDRDGTLCVERDGYLQTPEDWEALPGALDAIARLNQAGYHVVMAANMPGLGRGLFDVAALNAIHARMNKELAGVGGRVDAVFYCPHAPDEGCSCRKPLPGLFEQIGGGRRCGTVGKRLIFEQDARFQPGAVLFAGPGEFKFGRGGFAGFVGHPGIHSSSVNCASRPFFSRLAA